MIVLAIEWHINIAVIQMVRDQFDKSSDLPVLHQQPWSPCSQPRKSHFLAHYDWITEICVHDTHVFWIWWSCCYAISWLGTTRCRVDLSSIPSNTWSYSFDFENRRSQKERSPLLRLEKKHTLSGPQHKLPRAISSLFIPGSFIPEDLR